MKTCRYCGVSQPEEDFEIAVVDNGKVYRRLKCRKCKNETQALRVGKLRTWFDDYKKTLKCEKCGLADYRVLEFHHVNTSEKDFNVADMAQKGYSVQSILNEAAKCHVLCANCHRLEHFNLSGTRE